MKKVGMLKDMIRSAFQQPVTERYPAERRPAAENFRGLLYWHPEGCTGCMLCVKDCPAEAIELIIIDKAAKQFALRYHVDRCTFCGQCAYSCRFNCISLSKDGWELAELGREDFVVVYGSPLGEPNREPEEVGLYSPEPEIEPAARPV